MRRVSIMVACDACQSEITEEEDGASTVRFTARGQEREIDLCDDCLYGTFLQEARSVTNRKNRAKEFTCDFCGKSFTTQRGLSHHKTRQAHD